jgi:hypothetical protein
MGDFGEIIGVNDSLVFFNDMNKPMYQSVLI